MPTWKPIVTKIQETDAVKNTVVNLPLSQLAERTDYLKAIMENITASEFNYLSNMPVTAVAEIGQAVYWDSSNRRFGRALAAWNEDLSAYGSLLPAETSYFAGILVGKHTGNTGAVIISGYISDFQNLEALFGEASPEAGVYYVSGDNPGQLTKEAPPMSIPAVMYDGQGNILMLPTGAIVSQHDHHNYTLDQTNWLPETNAQFDNMNKPDGAMYGYDLANADPALDALFTLYTGTGVFTLYESGTILNDTFLVFNEDNIWILDDEVPPEDIIAHIAYPNAHGPNIVRSAKSNTLNYLTLSIVNGLMTIDFVEPTTSDTEDTSYTVVKDIANNILYKGPVVTQLVIGDGLSFTSEDGDGHGVCTLALTSETDVIRPADIINLNNAIQRTDGGLIYSVFPGGRDSSMTLAVDGGKWDGDPRQLKIRLWIRGTADNAVTPEFNLSVFVFPEASLAGVSLPTQYDTTIPAGAVSTDPSKYYLVEIDLADNVSVQSGSEIQYNIEPVDQPTEDLLILKQGITTYVVP
jgi:hypothetical protein